ncbi:hypothetical protein DWX45_00230 [Erysipelotrichaceae bacterium AF19-24AC]|nr:hypothetical protein DWX45_00230 [Erysipelotrichaceae bacterium AF19-24AC]
MLNITSFTALFLPLYIGKDLPSSINLHSYTDLDSALVQELLSHMFVLSRIRLQISGRWNFYSFAAAI